MTETVARNGIVSVRDPAQEMIGKDDLNQRNVFLGIEMKLMSRTFERATLQFQQICLQSDQT